MKFYGYKKCGTCRKAMKWLDEKNIAYDFIDITEQPPKQVELKKALAAGYQINDLFNKSGGQYRELNMKEQLPTMSPKEALKLLTGNGYLVKRPLCLDGANVTVGFNAVAYEETWG
ncbi:Spx/MgsR family RNA polymerase-binding regulatory protein [Rubripirellula reticaptiva]|uniref:Regulatory protein MgsR n=1 Tax=Rubripirellula reticaptiva TaxID=2528013 RepID=A0A5C6EJP9_9BACT|nr:Spx/MgsR family RNA polymerase-binding regulatory protein [Rubripirellula reticaptiva]TWU49038.1 Regulatory protein MgsR [Rubripirellula reticaptiva]